MTIYETVRLEDNTILRISETRLTMVALLLSMMFPIILVFIITAILAALLAKKMAQKIVEPLNSIDLDHPLQNNVYEELSPLLHRIYVLHREVNMQVVLLKQKKDEFDQIIRNMQEGLVLLDNQLKVLNINPMARRLFNASSDVIGKDFLTLNHNLELQQALQMAGKVGLAQMKYPLQDLIYQIDISKIESDGQYMGLVILVFDITQDELLMKSRQQFTANVSHELKTPLQSILGSAELMKHNLVKADDVPRFASLMYNQANHLLSLIENILRLSALDENQQFEFTDVDIQELVTEVFIGLNDLAEKHQVTLKHSGAGKLRAVRHLLFEVLHNLCENAIKYNKPQGQVSVNFGESEFESWIEVADTGIGIPVEHQQHIFERFYRVDKSHNKQSGGSGLGLSIVKHAVMYHHGKIELTSNEQQGTQIRISIPKKEDESH